MKLVLSLNGRQEGALREMVKTGFYGTSIEACAIRILDESFIDFFSGRYPLEPNDGDDSGESWRREPEEET